jgi:PPM family protein phosphatase
VCGRPAGSGRWGDHPARRDGDALLHRGEGLHQEGRLGLGAQTAARTDTGRVRENNEDRYLVREGGKTTLLAVADGVGGEAGGELASAAAIDALAASFFSSGASSTNPAEALAAAIRGANDAVLGAAGKSGQQGAASTLVAAAIAGGSAVIGNLGDSRAYLLRDGDIRLVTADHSGEFQSSITRFVGDPRGVQPDVFLEPLRPGDRLLLCSDGLTRHVPDGEIASTVRRADLDHAAAALVDLAKSRGGEDNITVVLYAAKRTFGLAGLRDNVVNLVLALLVATVVVGAIAALVLASGAYPAAR